MCRVQAGAWPLVPLAHAQQTPHPSLVSKDDMEGEDGMDVDEQVPEAAPAAPQGPIVDEDGFELVQRKGGRKGRR